MNNNTWTIQGGSPKEHDMVRVIVYEMKNGSEEVFELPRKEDEQHERAQAERAVHDRDSQVVGYRFEWQDK